MTRFNQPLGGNDMPRFGGPATMMRLPAATSAKGLDAAFIGIPMDTAPAIAPAPGLAPGRSAMKAG
jgi:guanidinobutyrase